MGASSLLVSWSCSLPKPATLGCSTRPINSPQGWPATATRNPSTSKKMIPPFVIDWKGNYRIEGPAFIYSDRQTRRVSTILGYPTHLLASPS
jgi:hypothetical protein